MQQIESIINTQAVNSVRVVQADQNTAPFSNLSAGDTVDAEVVSVSGREATLKTADGREVRAQFQEGISIKAGDMVELTLVSKDPGMVRLRLSAVNGQTINLESSGLQVYLMEMGLPPSQANEAAIQLLLRYQVEPTSQKVANLFQTAMSLPEIPESIAVLMAEARISPTQENADVLIKWITSPATFGEDVENVKEMFQQAAQEQTAGIFRNAAMQRIAVEHVELLHSTKFEQLVAQLSQLHISDAEVQIAIKTFLEGAQVPAAEQQTLETILKESFQTAQKFAAEAKNPNMQEQPAATEMQKVGVATERSVAQTVTQIQAGEKNEVDAPVQAASDRGTNEAAKLMEVVSRFFARLKGQDIGTDAKTLQETVQSQQGLAESLKAGTARMMGETSSVAQKANDVNAQVQLGSQMEPFYYCQLPYEMAERKGTAELYIFERRKREETDEKSSTTVLIGLDTQYMGRVETVLRSEEDTLSVEFRVEDESVERFFTESVEEFDRLMQEDGFTLNNTRIIKIEERTTPLNALKAIEQLPKEIRIAGIDIQV